jgi:hypothetical protein
MQEPVRIITASEDGSEGRTSWVIMNTVPGTVHPFLRIFLMPILVSRMEMGILTGNHSEQGKVVGN